MSELRGHWGERWQPVAEAFERNRREWGDEAAALAVYRGGEPLLSLHTGEANPGQPWTEDTRVNLFSASKGLVALSVLRLVDEGVLALEQRVSHYWPEFGRAGKGDIRVWQLLGHRSGLSALSEPVPEEAIFDWDEMIRRIERAEPWWPPGQAQGYSPFLFGWALGELVRRAAGVASCNEWLSQAVCRPLGLNLGFGASGQPPVARPRALKRPISDGVGEGADSQSLGHSMKADPRGVTNRAFANPASLLNSSHRPEWRRAEIPAANGHSSARDLAALYGALASDAGLGGQKLLSPPILALCARELSGEADRVLGLRLRFGHGFMLTQKRADCRFGRGRGAFGHPGAGGSLGFADPEFGIGFGYVTARMGQSLLIDPRPRRLIDAVYQVLGETP